MPWSSADEIRLQQARRALRLRRVGIPAFAMGTAWFSAGILAVYVFPQVGTSFPRSTLSALIGGAGALAIGAWISTYAVREKQFAKELAMRKRETERQVQEYGLRVKNIRLCLHCKGALPVGATRCPFCGRQV